MEIRKANLEDIDCLMEIFAYARSFMKEHGNPKQWGAHNWPPKELIERDIINGNSYVCLNDGRIVGTFCYMYGEKIEPTYKEIEGGKWIGNDTYGVIHRLAGDGSAKGTGAFCINWAYEQCGHLRIDTHGDNKVMQKLVEKLGFVYCGNIHVLHDSEIRYAYEKL